MLDYEAKALLGFTAHIIENVERSQKLIEEKIDKIKLMLEHCVQCEYYKQCKLQCTSHKQS